MVCAGIVMSYNLVLNAVIFLLISPTFTFGLQTRSHDVRQIDDYFDSYIKQAKPDNNNSQINIENTQKTIKQQQKNDEISRISNDDELIGVPPNSMDIYYKNKLLFDYFDSYMRKDKPEIKKTYTNNEKTIPRQQKNVELSRISIDDDIMDSTPNTMDIYFKDKLLFEANDLQQKKPAEDTEDRIKAKLISLARTTKDGVDKQLQQIKKKHRMYKNHRLYVIGYLVSHLINLYDRLTVYSQNIETNKKRWSSLKTLQAYEKVKTKSDIILRLLDMLRKIVERQTITEHEISRKIPNINKLPSKLEDKISWSYYDDNLM